MAVAPLLLRGLELLRSVEAAELDALAPHINLQEFARRQVVYEKGSPAQALYFVLSGRLQAVDFTVDAREVGLFFAEPGQHFGELAMLDSPQREETMIALGPSKVLRLEATMARSFFARQPSVAWGLLDQMARRLRHAALQRRLLALPHPAQRVGAQLLELMAASNPPAAGTPTSADSAPLRIDPMPTHQELAIMINASRETVTRVFQQLQNRNMVQRDGHSLLLIDIRALEALALQGPVDW